MWSVFKYFDTTDSGYITVDSVILALKESGVVVNEEGLRDTFKELKKNGKSINFKEFKDIAFKSFGENEEGDGEENKNKENQNIEIEEREKKILKINNSNESSKIEEIKEDIGM